VFRGINSSFDGVCGAQPAAPKGVLPARGVVNSLSAGFGPLLPRVGLYKRFVYFEAVVHESILLLLPPPTCIAHTIAIL